jgi:DNA-binding response OmpR family regulator
VDILVIEDDRRVAETIRLAWPVPSDKLRFLSTYRQSIHLIHSSEIDFFDAVIIDIHLPDGDGMTILRTIRERTDLPVILISGSGTADYRADSIDRGADDYVMKPFSVRELQARLKRLVARREGARPQERTPVFDLGGLECDLQRMRLTCGSVELPLTAAESRILGHLHENLDRICSKSSLYKHAFFREYQAQDKTLDVYVGRLRRKLDELSSGRSALIQTARGSGYRLTTGSFDGARPERK